MNFEIKLNNQKARIKNDFSLGLPILIKKNNTSYIVYPTETIKKNILDGLLKKTINKPYLVITERRAKSLNIMVYDKGLARLRLPKKFASDFLKKIIDPTHDLSSPMSGPYMSKKTGSNEIEEFCLQLCKDAMLLPSIIISKISKSDRGKLFEKGLLEYDIAKLNKPEETDINIEKISDANFSIKNFGEIQFHVFRCLENNEEHYAIEVGSPSRKKTTVVRIHSACFTGDVFGSLKCDCGPQLQASLEYIKKIKKGIIIYLNQEGRGIGLANKMRAYTLQSQGYDTVEANHRLGFEDEERNLIVGSKILKVLGFKDIELLTNNPKKINAIKSAGINISRHLNLRTKPTKENINYLITKAKKSGHFL